MRPGSIVELVTAFKMSVFMAYPETKFPVKHVKYTVRSIKAFQTGVGIQLEEIVNVPIDSVQGFMEPYFDMNNFREIQFPDDLMEEVDEAIHAPVPDKFPSWNPTPFTLTIGFIKFANPEADQTDYKNI